MASSDLGDSGLDDCEYKSLSLARQQKHFIEKRQKNKVLLNVETNKRNLLLADETMFHG